MSLRRNVSIAVLLAVAFITGILFTTAGANLLAVGHLVGTTTEAADLGDGTTRLAADRPTGQAGVLEDAFTEVAEAVNPTVVQIHSEKVNRRPAMQNPFEGTPFEDFFGTPENGEGREFRSQALGSGVIVASDGYIVTNNHVIDGADELEVKMYDGTRYEAEVVGTDPLSDLAVIRVDAEGLPAISFGQMDDVRIGQWVLAFGSPLAEELDNTVTAGIVSAINRTSANLSRYNQYSSFIQTDAAINPGNSGGALVNLRGELIGINAMIYSRSGGYQGIGFAIPIDLVENVARQLIESGTVERGFLGVGYGPVSDALAEALDLPRGAAQITNVQPGSAAADAGLREGDIILAIDGQPLNAYTQLPTIVGNSRPGDDIRLEVVRDGDRRTVDVTLGRRDQEAIAADTGTTEDEDSSMEALGLTLSELTDQLQQQLGLEGTVRGALVASIDENSDAYREGDLRRGDIITEVARQPVESPADFMAIYRDVEAGETFLVRVTRPLRGGQTQGFITALTKPD